MLLDVRITDSKTLIDLLDPPYKIEQQSLLLSLEHLLAVFGGMNTDELLVEVSQGFTVDKRLPNLSEIFLLDILDQEVDDLVQTILHDESLHGLGFDDSILEEAQLEELSSKCLHVSNIA
jgi:hypothetical protein